MSVSRLGKLLAFRREKCRRAICKTGSRLGHCAVSTLFFGFLFCVGASAHAQARVHALPTASRAGDLQFGGGLVLGTSNYNFTPTNLTGFAFYTTFDARAHWGGEFNFRNSKTSADSTVYERTYQIGPRVYVSRGRLGPYAKVLIGRGVYNFHNSAANVAYNMYTYGGGADFAATHWLNVRGDYEYQNWAGFPLGTLHPSVFTIGLAYHFPKELRPVR